MTQISVEKIYSDLRDSLGLVLLSEPIGEEHVLQAPDVHRPGMALMGHTANFLPNRLQVVGESEMTYLASLDPTEQRHSFARVVDLPSSACFVAGNQDVPAGVLEICRRRRYPLFRTAVQTVELISELSRYLEKEFAPHTEMHGTLVDVYGVGLLFTGRSGIGKSECALDLIERGHRLVADDVVQITRTGEDIIVGSFREVLAHNLEIRGVGVIDVQAIFGIRAIRAQKRIECEVQLMDWDDHADYERMGLERQFTRILDVDIPQAIVPLFPGKNITVIAETIALDYMLRVYGYDAAQALNDRIMTAIQQDRGLETYLRRDKE